MLSKKRKIKNVSFFYYCFQEKSFHYQYKDHKNLPCNQTGDSASIPFKSNPYCPKRISLFLPQLARNECIQSDVRSRHGHARMCGRCLRSVPYLVNTLTLIALASLSTPQRRGKLCRKNAFLQAFFIPQGRLLGNYGLSIFAMMLNWNFKRIFLSYFP